MSFVGSMALSVATGVVTAINLGAEAGAVVTLVFLLFDVALYWPSKRARKRVR